MSNVNQATATLPSRSARETGHAPGQLYAYIAEFDSPEALMSAAAQVRDAGFTRWDTFSPFPIHGIEGAMGIRATKLPFIVFACGLAGALLGLGLQWWANASNPENFLWLDTSFQGYQFEVSGKPFFSLPANIPIIFELTILLAAFGAVFGMLALNNLPRLSNPLHSSVRFKRVTNDRFFVAIEAADPHFDRDETRSFLAALGPAAVEDVFEERTEAAPPKWFRQVGVLLVCAALIPLGLIAKARVSKSTEPRIHIVQDMDNQERFKSQQAHPLFADGRAMRPPIVGTVARGEVYEDGHFYRGVVGSDWATTFPTERPEITMTESFVRHGEQRYNIYCAPCHGVDGHGQGPVRVRSEELESPLNVLSLHDPEIRARPVGHIFNTITNGIRTMPSYGSQIPPEDRWAIIAYVRALQVSQHASYEDVPAEKRPALR